MGSGTCPREWQVSCCLGLRVSRAIESAVTPGRVRVCVLLRSPAQRWTRACALHGACCLCSSRSHCVWEIAQSTGGSTHCLGRYERASGLLVFFGPKSSAPPHACASTCKFTHEWWLCSAPILRHRRGGDRAGSEFFIQVTLNLDQDEPDADLTCLSPTSVSCGAFLTARLAPDDTLVCVLFKCSCFVSELLFS